MQYVLMPQWELQGEGQGARMDVMLGVSAGCGDMPAAFWRPVVPPFGWLGCLATRKGGARGCRAAWGLVLAYRAGSTASLSLVLSTYRCRSRSWLLV